MGRSLFLKGLCTVRNYGEVGFVVEKFGYLIFSHFISQGTECCEIFALSAWYWHTHEQVVMASSFPQAQDHSKISITLWLLMQERWVSVRANAIRNTKLFTLYIHGFFNHQLYICVLSTPSRHAVSQHWAPYVEIMTEEFLYLWFRQLSFFPI